MRTITETKNLIKSDIQELKSDLNIEDLNVLSESEYEDMLKLIQFIKNNFKIVEGKLKINWLKFSTNIKLLGYIAKYLIIIIKSVWSRVNKRQ